MTKWTKQSYEMVAKILRDAREDPDSDVATLTDSLTDSFAKIFRIDNPQFDEGRFRRAAGSDDDERFIIRHPTRFRRRPEVRVRPYQRRA